METRLPDKGDDAGGVKDAGVLPTMEESSQTGANRMTLVVARVEKGRIAIAADTLITAHGKRLPVREWALKSICLPGNICVSFSGSPELATKSFAEFRNKFPRGTDFSGTVSFFERSSHNNMNDYIIAFGNLSKLITIRNGARVQSMAKTHWIGDKDAYERFREYEHRAIKRSDHGRAISVSYFADEMEHSPASKLYSAMRCVVQDQKITSVGGFITLISYRDIGFRFSAYSDLLYDWPAELADDEELKYSHKFRLKASDENDRYSISQISPGYYNINLVAFYVLKGRILFLFHENSDGSTACTPERNVEPDKIAATLDLMTGGPFHALCTVLSARQEFPMDIPPSINPDEGLGLAFYCEVNTFSDLTIK